jgi:pimeloyl-ACP methyl ester carboxylesterase
MIRELYTVQLADLASHGYIVAAMTHSYDGFLTVFPDGSSVTHDARRWPKIPSVEGEANRNQLEWHTADMLTVLEHLRRLNRTPNSPSPVSGHLDLGRVGAFGHSFGGVAAAHACQSEPQIRACLNQDGAMGMNPFYRTPDGWGMDQAFLLIERPPNRDPLTPADLAALKMTREQAAQLIEHLNANRDRTLRSTGKGSYRVLLLRNQTTHLDFTDLPLLSASNNREWEHRKQVVELIQRYTRAFFDKHVRGNKAPDLDRHTPTAILESVEIFPPAKRPKRRTSGQSPN